jgi:protease-4
MTFFDYLKNIFLILVILSILPRLIDSLHKQYGSFFESKTKVGVVSIKGIIYDSTHHNKHLSAYFKDPSIKAILLKIECPGGAAGTSQAIYNEIKELKKEYPKPVIALIENVCASGGYYIACASDHIIASGSATVGSIGAYLPLSFQLKEFIEQYKVHYAPVKAGRYKTVGDPFVDRTPEETALLQGMLNDTYAQFSTDVATARKLSLKEITQWGEGKVFSGRQALALGLIDALGSAKTAERIIKEKALIDDAIEWVKPPESSSILSFFSDPTDEGENNMFSSCVNEVCSVVENRYFAQRIH